MLNDYYYHWAEHIIVLLIINRNVGVSIHYIESRATTLETVVKTITQGVWRKFIPPIFIFLES